MKTLASRPTTELPPLRRDFPALLLLLFVLCLELFSWSLLDGYQLADEIEYMEHAQAMARGETVLDSQTIRAFGFSAVLAPIFWIADRAGVEDWQQIVWIVRVIQMGLGLWLCRIAMRLGTRLAGRTAGLLAAFAVGVNPVFLQYAVSPVSGLAAAVAAGMGLEALAERGDARRGVKAGLWLGAAVLLAYQCIIVAGPAVLVVLARDRTKHLRHFLGICGGIALAVLAQVVFDRLVYGEWGATLGNYFFANFSSPVAKVLNACGLHDLARTVYLRGSESMQGAELHPEQMRSLTPRSWYLVHLPEMLVWPILAGFLLGAIRSLRRPSWLTWGWLAILALNLVLMSEKGAKDFRLWLPLLPMIGSFAGAGLAWIAGTSAARGAYLRRLVTAGMCMGAAWLGVGELWARNTRKFSGYWQAMEMVSAKEHARRAAGSTVPKARVASAYHWAVFLRGGRDVELTKLPWQLDDWSKYEPKQRQDDLLAISQVDWLLVHLPVLTNYPDLMNAVNAYFQVVGYFWNHRDFEDIGPVFVLERRRSTAPARSFFEVHDGIDPETFAAERGLGEPVHFVRRMILPDPASSEPRAVLERVDFLGFQYETLPGDDHGWITYHWACRSPLYGDYTIVDRLTTPDERSSWQNDHPPAYGVHPTQSSREGGWQAGWIVSESWPVVAAAEPYEWDRPYRPMGGDWRRGDLLPASLWIELATFGPDPAHPEQARVTGSMEPAREGEDVPIRRGPEAGVRRTSDGWCFSSDGLVRVGRFFLPVHPGARLPDNGRPVPP
jgi:hypothetical protein